MYESCLRMLQTMVTKLVMQGEVSKFNIGYFPRPNLGFRMLQGIDDFPILGNQKPVLGKL